MVETILPDKLTTSLKKMEAQLQESNRNAEGLSSDLESMKVVYYLNLIPCKQFFSCFALLIKFRYSKQINEPGVQAPHSHFRLNSIFPYKCDI